MSDHRSHRQRDDGERLRHGSHSHDSREPRKYHDDEDSDGCPPQATEDNRLPRPEQLERRRHHKHRHKRSRRSLSPGEVSPEKHHSRHHHHKQKDNHHRDNDAKEQSTSPVKVEDHVGSPQSPEAASSDSDEVFGPMPAPQSDQQVHKSTRPRGRGEFGHDPKDIARYEQMGFVMSGNRKKRRQPEMSDEQLRKAGYAAQKEVRDLKEKELVEKFKTMVEMRKRESNA